MAWEKVAEQQCGIQRTGCDQAEEAIRSHMTMAFVQQNKKSACRTATTHICFIKSSPAFPATAVSAAIIHVAHSLTIPSPKLDNRMLLNTAHAAEHSKDLGLGPCQLPKHQLYLCIQCCPAEHNNSTAVSPPAAQATLLQECCHFQAAVCCTPLSELGRRNP